jgi:guanine deaminase
VTPRFIPSCTDATLAGLGQIAQEYQCHVQTHCSESDWAHAHVLARCGCTDATALDRFGLLTRRTVLAHSNFLTDDDMTRLATRGTAVAHCPVSNAYFANSVFPLRHALERQVNAGLGTDISGGPIASLWDAMRATVMVSRMLQDGTDPALPSPTRGRPGAAVTLATAFHLATAGGGRALDLPIGLIAPGYRADLLTIDTTAPQGGIRLFGETDTALILQKILYTATRANIASVRVDGRPLPPRP